MNTGFNKPVIRKVRLFIRTYAAQTAFAAFILLFLAFSVSNGQSYTSAALAYNYSDQQSQTHAQGFIGKPQVFTGQTILTGEVQQVTGVLYKVEQGDTLTNIADRYDISVGTIIDANNLKTSQLEKITPGMELLIPANDTNTSTAWLSNLNQLKADQAKQAADAQTRALAQQRASQSRIGSVFTGTVKYAAGYTILGRQYGPPNEGIPGQCTWYVGTFKNWPGPMGNANEYLASARRYGIPTGTTPRIGAVMQTSESWYGHVAIVVGLSGGMITIREMNYVAPYVVDQRTFPVTAPFIRGYIYR